MKEFKVFVRQLPYDRNGHRYCLDDFNGNISADSSEEAAEKYLRIDDGQYKSYQIAVFNIEDGDIDLFHVVSQVRKKVEPKNE